MIRHYFPYTEKPLPYLMQAQIHLPFIFDTISRQDQHHLAIHTTESGLFRDAFLDLIAAHLADQNQKKALNNVGMIYLNLEKFAFREETPKQIEKLLEKNLEDAKASHSHMILVIDSFEPLFESQTSTCPIAKILKQYFLKSEWRFIVLSHSHLAMKALEKSPLNSHFSSLKIPFPHHEDAIAILKSQRDALENTYPVLIAEECFSYAFRMTSQYLKGEPSHLEKALHLIESACLRLSMQETTDETQEKPYLNAGLLAQVISSWTHIPVSHFIDSPTQTLLSSMQKHIYGQDPAIELCCLHLQYARLKLEKRGGPLSSFLFTGPDGIGKSLTAKILAEHLFSQEDAILKVQIDPNVLPKSLADLRTIHLVPGFPPRTLLEAIRETPYAVVLLENIQDAPSGFLDLFHDVFTQGLASDPDGNIYDFRHAILIMTTNIGASDIIQVSQIEESEQMGETSDLMQLIMNQDPIKDYQFRQPLLSAQELSHSLRPTLTNFFSNRLVSTWQIIPFSLLDALSLEKIIRHKIKGISAQLEKDYAVELLYAPEVLSFLVQTCRDQIQKQQSIDQVFSEHLFPAISHEFIHFNRAKNRKRLHLQLNETGQVLRCEWLSAEAGSLYQHS